MHRQGWIRGETRGEWASGLVGQIDLLSYGWERKQEGGSRTGELPAPVELKDGEGTKKLAFLAFSSGTTGLPKAVCIPHASVIANIIMVVRQWDQRSVPGEKA